MPLLVIEPPVLSASARTNCTPRREGGAGASFAWNTERLQDCRLAEVKAVVRSIVAVCMFKLDRRQELVVQTESIATV